MPLNCFGIHDWSDPYFDDEGLNELQTAVIRCLACGKKKTFIPGVDFLLPFEDEIFSRIQSAYRTNVHRE